MEIGKKIIIMVKVNSEETGKKICESSSKMVDSRCNKNRLLWNIYLFSLLSLRLPLRHAVFVYMRRQKTGFRLSIIQNVIKIQKLMKWRYTASRTNISEIYLDKASPHLFYKNTETVTDITFSK